MFILSNDWVLSLITILNYWHFEHVELSCIVSFSTCLFLRKVWHCFFFICCLIYAFFPLFFKTIHCVLEFLFVFFIEKSGRYLMHTFKWFYEKIYQFFFLNNKKSRIFRDYYNNSHIIEIFLNITKFSQFNYKNNKSFLLPIIYLNRSKYKK